MLTHSFEIKIFKYLYLIKIQMDSVDRQLRRLLPRLRELSTLADLGNPDPQPEPSRPRTSTNYVRHIENLITELEDKIDESQSSRLFKFIYFF